MKLVENKDFIELGVDNVLTQEQIDFIKDNPPGLTKEGCLEELRNWKNSSNKHLRYMYEKMLQHSKSFKNSGFTKDGSIIFAIRNGKVSWYKPVKKED